METHQLNYSEWITIIAARLTKKPQKYENGAVVTFNFHDKGNMKQSELEAEPKIILQSHHHSPTFIPIIAIGFVLVLDLFAVLLLIDSESVIEYLCIVCVSILIHMLIANFICEARKTFKRIETVVRIGYLVIVYLYSSYIVVEFLFGQTPFRRMHCNRFFACY